LSCAFIALAASTANRQRESALDIVDGLADAALRRAVP